MPVRIVQSKQNARLKELRRVLAHGGRDESGLAGIEGPHLVLEAVRAGLRIQSIFAAQELGPFVEQLQLAESTEKLFVPRNVLAEALTTETPQPVAALVEPPEWTWTRALGIAEIGEPLLVVLAGLQDPGNLGTIVRSAEAFGASGVICLPGTVNAWNPKAVRASAGSVFRMPVLNVDEADALRHLREAGVAILATAVLDAKPANEVNFAAGTALLIGNEGSGLPKELVAQADGVVTIPCPGPVESLNAAVAASVLLYEASRQRARQGSDAGPGSAR